MSRLVIVSNRIPAGPGKPASGGLAVALEAALQESGGVWFGWSGETTTEGTGEPTIKQDGKVTYATVDLTEEDFDEYYNGFANKTLWPLFHYRIDLTAFDRQFYQGYMRVNAHFAEYLSPHIQNDDIVWVHDYHLIPLGEELRRSGINNPIGYFLHIPFPAPQIILTLPMHQQLVRALFAFDIVGFQTETDVQAFREYVLQEANGEDLGDGVLKAFGETLIARAFPIGIETEDYAKIATGTEAMRHMERMKKSLNNRGLIIGVDRLDYTKGLAERFNAIERFFEDFPENHNRASVLQIAPTSREQVEAYQDIRQQLEALSGHINGRFAEFDWMPIRYLNRSFTRPALAGLFRAAQVGLVTPFRDGMNLVAKEFVAAQDPEDPGVLVLSRFAGAAQQLNGAVIVNPYDNQGVAEGLQQALHMHINERVARWNAMWEGLVRDDVHAWRKGFVDSLAKVADERK